MRSLSSLLVSGWEPFLPADSGPVALEAISLLKQYGQSNAQILAAADARWCRFAEASKFYLCTDIKMSTRASTHPIFEYEVLHTNLVKYIIHVDSRFSRRFHEEEAILLSISLGFLQQSSGIELHTPQKYYFIG
jgi:hypothetical protein